MKKTVKILLALVLVLIAAAGILAVAAGDAAVMFNGTTNEIEFQNVNPFGSNTQPDLFAAMKDMMPGDSVTQQIKIGAKSVETDTIKIYLRAANANDDFKKLVEACKQWVTLTVKNGDTEITGDLDSGVVLGQFKNNGTRNITVTLAIDPAADNTLQDLAAEVDWIFTAEVIPETPAPPPGGGGGDTPSLVEKHVNYLVGYADGTIRPNAPITRAEVATIFFRLLTDETREQMMRNTCAYPDVNQGDWYYLAVSTLTNGGILQGYPDGNFRPNDPITRAELATVICRFDKKFGTISSDKTFRDVRGHWAEAYIEFSAERGYVMGYTDGTFRPQQDITRAETVAMVNRLLHRGVDEAGLPASCKQWPDNYKGTWYYYEILEAATNHDYRRSTRKAESGDFFYENWKSIKSPVVWSEKETG